jgi:hypothetical protein
MRHEMTDLVMANALARHIETHHRKRTLFVKEETRQPSPELSEAYKKSPLKNSGMKEQSSR